MSPFREQLQSIVTNVDWSALRTDVVTAGALGCTGDLICQQAIEGQSSMDWRRFFAVSTFEALYMGGAFHFLCQIFPLVVCTVGRKLPASYALSRQLQATGSAAHAFGCAICDNIHDGACMIPIYFLSVGMLQGDSVQQALRNLRMTIFVANRSLWLACRGACAFSRRIPSLHNRIWFAAFFSLGRGSSA